MFSMSVPTSHCSWGKSMGDEDLSSRMGMSELSSTLKSTFGSESVPADEERPQHWGGMTNDKRIAVAAANNSQPGRSVPSLFWLCYLLLQIPAFDPHAKVSCLPMQLLLSDELIWKQVLMHPISSTSSSLLPPAVRTEAEHVLSLLQPSVLTPLIIKLRMINVHGDDVFTPLPLSGWIWP